ncbi:methylenetetrahydrofolate reductase C-terminal domain-containing protein [Thermosediminibacter oceani]|uniref:Methylene-tetrahydrofolate reductase C-terminal-like domain-containing protein n=1 Tax=Thermosediminibacter oceani (strain ATCC BAA-1034 / DSM 16646 / JW/IW-1228P) TaxID=555079 RepID=D9S2E2_THEOJ|nr:methylenetetrahydrofolate reductase C-terminal domain-containing protein [Thermosediminibacter oceani]ADL07569.1 conserved hypothetical protein [Thermosediminibacter oceani DSM 16646]
MIIMQGKPFEKILEMLKDVGKVFITGCSLCATFCMAGGEQQIIEMKERLENEGKEVTGFVVFEASCNRLQVRSALKKKKEELGKAQAVLCMACGDGAQTVAGVLEDIPVYPANDTLFIGEVERIGHFSEMCRACGECELGWTAGICPVTRCAKGLLNGPCGGSRDGKCELDRENECAWVLIYDRLKKMGRLENIKEIRAPKDYSRAYNPRKIVLARRKEG